MPHCFDTSAFLECWSRYYPIDVFPGLWARLDELAADAELLAPDEVLRELERKEDELHRWAKARPHIFLALDEPIQAATRAILASHRLLAKEFARRTHADPFVIALAQVRGLTVVTQEGPGSENRPTIPYVCTRLGVDSINIIEFIREQGWTF